MRMTELVVDRRVLIRFWLEWRRGRREENEVQEKIEERWNHQDRKPKRNEK